MQSKTEYTDISSKQFEEKLKVKSNTEGFFGLKFTQVLKLTNTNLPKTIYFTNCLFNEQVYLNNDQEGKIKFVFENCIFQSFLRIQNPISTSSFVIEINKCEAKEEILFEGSFSVIYITSKCEKIKLDGCDIDYCSIDGSYVTYREIKNLEIRRSLFNFLSVSKLQIEWFEFSSNIKRDSSISISKIECCLFELSNVHNEGLLRLSDITPFFSGSIIPEFFDIEPLPRFQIEGCNLNKAEFYRMDLKSFYLVVINDSVISDCIFVNIKWCDKISSDFVNSSLYSKLEYKNGQKELYRQIRFAVSKQGNYWDEQHFHVKELNALNESLTYKNHFWTKLILRLSRLSSNYGISLIRPIVFLVALNSILFLLFIN